MNARDAALTNTDEDSVLSFYAHLCYLFHCICWIIPSKSKFRGQQGVHSWKGQCANINIKASSYTTDKHSKQQKKKCIGL